MAEKNTLARPYAIAAFKQALEEDKLDLWLDMLRTLAMVAADPRMTGIIHNPRISKPDLTELLLEITKEILSKTGENFVRVLVGANRMGVIGEILGLFEAELDSLNKLAHIQVNSAYPLTPEYRNTIKKAMAVRLDREVDIQETVDENLIGGVLIRAGDVVIDLSLRGRLIKLEAELAL